MTPIGRLAIIRAFANSELLVAMNFVIVPALIGIKGDPQDRA